jgi:hypothetical protein
MDYQKQIDAILEQALTEKTFNLDVIGKIKELRDGFSKAQEQIKDYIENKKNNEIAYSKLLKEKQEVLLENEKLVSTITEWKKREEELVKREKTASILEVNLQNQTRRADEIKELFGWLIKGPTVVRTKSGTIPITVPGGNGMQGYATTTNVNTTETEQVA